MVSQARILLEHEAMTRFIAGSIEAIGRRYGMLLSAPPPPTLAEFAAAQGIELLPWQIAAAEAIERGECPYIAGGPRAGRKRFFRLLEEWRSGATTQATNHEIRRDER